MTKMTGGPSHPSCRPIKENMLMAMLSLPDKGMSGIFPMQVNTKYYNRAYMYCIQIQFLVYFLPSDKKGTLFYSDHVQHTVAPRVKIAIFIYNILEAILARFFGTPTSMLYNMIPGFYSPPAQWMPANCNSQEAFSDRRIWNL